MSDRRKWSKRAGKQRKALDPLAASLGVDSLLGNYEAPSSMEQRAYFACTVGQSLLGSFGSPALWPGSGIEHSPPRQSVQGAKKLEKALTSDRCLNAVAWVTQRFGIENAAVWSRAADSGKYASSESKQLCDRAARSESLAQFVAEAWTVDDPFGALTIVKEAADSRLDLAIRAPQIDLDAYFEKAETICGAIGLALGSDLDEFSEVLFAAVWTLDLSFSLALGVTWNDQLPLWNNLLQDEPRAHLDLVQESAIRMSAT